jgi:hypothetical protein
VWAAIMLQSCNGQPGFQRALGIRMDFPKLLKPLPRNHVHRDCLTIVYTPGSLNRGNRVSQVSLLFRRTGYKELLPRVNHGEAETPNGAAHRVAGSAPALEAIRWSGWLALLVFRVLRGYRMGLGSHNVSVLVVCNSWRDVDLLNLRIAVLH